jgi:hypothetical protein
LLLAPSSSHTAELWDEPTQLRRLEDAKKLNFRELKKRRRRLQKP